MHHFEEHIVESRRRKASENLLRQHLINTSPHLRQGENGEEGDDHDGDNDDYEDEEASRRI